MDSQRQRLEEWREKKRLASIPPTRPPLQPRQKPNTTLPSTSTATRSLEPSRCISRKTPSQTAPLSAKTITPSFHDKEKRPTNRKSNIPLQEITPATTNEPEDAKGDSKRDEEESPKEIRKSVCTQRKSLSPSPKNVLPEKGINNDASSSCGTTKRIKPVTRVIQSRYMQSSAHNSTIATKKSQNVSVKRAPTESKSRKLTEPYNSNLENIPMTSPKNETITVTCTPRRQLRDLNADEILALPSPAEERSRPRRTSEIQKEKHEFIPTESPPLLPSAHLPLPDSKTSSRSEDIDLLSMRLQQWCFLNAQMSKSAERRAKNAEEQLSAAYVLLARKKEELSYQKAMLQSEQELAVLTNETDAQNQILESLANHMEGFSKRYTEFASAIQTASTVLQTSHIVTEDLDRIPEAAAQCVEVLDTLAESHGDSFEEIERFSNDVSQLFELAQTRMQDLRECRELLEAVDRAETMDRSLAVQDIQRIQMREARENYGYLT